MVVLVTAASKHGGTAEIADVIAKRLGSHDIDVRQGEPETVRSLDGVDAAVIGSGVYAGHWLPDAKQLIDRFEGAWPRGRVWLFSSGPLGDPPKPEEDPVDVDHLMEDTGAVEHVVFNGRLDRDKLGFGERALVRALRAPVGDFRDWPAIGRWADTIAGQLAPTPEVRTELRKPS